MTKTKKMRSSSRFQNKHYDSTSINNRVIESNESNHSHIIHSSYRCIIASREKEHKTNDKTEARIVLETGTAHWTGQIIVSQR